jgi:iron complex transport system substrate-binding protein
VEGTVNSIKVVGDILNARTRADSLVRELRSGLAEISALLTRTERRKVYVEITANPLMTATENSFVGELVNLAGGSNLVEGLKPYLVINPERIVKENPEVVLITHPISTPEEVRDRVGWGDVRAVREDRIYTVNPDLVLRPGPRLVAGVMELVEKIHPEIVVGRQTEK